MRFLCRRPTDDVTAEEGSLYDNAAAIGAVAEERPVDGRNKCAFI